MARDIKAFLAGRFVLEHPYHGFCRPASACRGRVHCSGAPTRLEPTQLLLGFGAILTEVTGEIVRDALQASRTADVRQWVADRLGVTLFARRKLAYASATKCG